MAEALGVAASIAGLVSLADTVVRLGYKYFKDVKSAPECIEKLIRETNSLAGILHSLKNVVEILEAKYQSDTSIQIHEINACQKTLDRIEDRLSRFLSKGKSNKYKWPFEKSTVEGLIHDIESHKTAMAIAMDAQEMATLIDLLDGQQNIMHGLASVQATLKSDQEEWKKIELNETRRKLLNLLGTLDVRKWQNTNIRLRQPGTGVWFTDSSEFQSWLSTSCSKLWVYGIAGAGKTVLIASAIQELEKIFHSSSKHATAIFYCDYKDSQTHDPRAILGALARQLIVRKEDCFAQLERFCKAHDMDEHTQGTATLEDIRDLIIELSHNFDSVNIVVDGLDEINKDRADVTTLLDSLNTPHGVIRTLFASRKEIDIERILSTYPAISIAARGADLRLYVRSEIDKRSSKGKLRIQDPELKDHIIKVLTQGADGMFRWVACQIDYLCECSTDDDRREALQKLPPDLPSSYERILERVNRSIPENQALVRRALQWIVYSGGSYEDSIYRRASDTKQVDFEYRKFGKIELLQALAVRPSTRAFKTSSMPEEDRVLHWCSSLIRQKEDGDGFEIAHFTVKEFLLAIDPLQKPEFAQYKLSGDEAELSITCMAFLQCVDFDGLPSPAGQFDTDNFLVSWNRFVRKYPLAAYSVRRWKFHVSQSQWDKVEKETLGFLDQNASESLWKLEKCQFDLWNGTNPFLGPQDIMPTTETLLKTLSALHWASMFALPNACKSLIWGRGADVNRQSLAGTPMCCALTTATFPVGYENELWLFEDQRGIDEVVKLLVAAGADLETKIDPNGTYTALLLALNYCIGGISDDIALYELLDADVWISKEDALFVLAQFDITLSEIILDQAIETDFKFVSKDAFPTLFIMAILLLAYSIRAGASASTSATDVLASFFHGTCDCIESHDIPELFSALQFKNIFLGPDGETLDSFSPGLFEPERVEEYICEPEKILKQFSLAVRISSRNLVSSVEPAVFELVLQRKELQVISFLLRNGVEVDFNWVGPNKNSILHTFLDNANESRLQDTILFDLLLSQGIDFDNVDSGGRHSLQIMAAPHKLSMFRKMWDAINMLEIFRRSPDLPLKVLQAAGKHGMSVKVLKLTICRILDYGGTYRATVHDYVVDGSINDFCAERRQAYYGSEGNLLPKDQKGNTKMHLLSGNHNPLALIELMELIWKEAYQSDLEVLNDMNLTPLAIAVRSKNTVAVKLLLHAGVDTTQKFHYGQTVLHIACVLGNDEAVKELLRAHVDVFAKDDFGHTAADIAIQNGYTGLAGLIQESIDGGLGAEVFAQASEREFGNQSEADTFIDGDSEAPALDGTPATVISASLDETHSTTLKLVHRPSKKTIRSSED